MNVTYKDEFHPLYWLFYDSFKVTICSFFSSFSRLLVSISSVIPINFWSIILLRIFPGTENIVMPRNFEQSVRLKGPWKRMQHCWPTTRNILGPIMLRPFAWYHNNVGICWHLLRIVWNRSNFGATSPNISIVLWQAKRSATILRPFAWNHNNVGLVKTSEHAHCNRFLGLLY